MPHKKGETRPRQGRAPESIGDESDASDPSRSDHSVASWRWEIIRSDLSTRARLVALALAVRMNSDGSIPRRYAVGIRRLAQDTGYRKLDVVIHALAELQEHGWLDIEEAGGRPGVPGARPNHYRILFPHGDRSPEVIVHQRSTTIDHLDGVTVHQRSTTIDHRRYTQPAQETTTRNQHPSSTFESAEPLILDEERSDPDSGLEVWVDPKSGKTQRVDRLWDAACEIWGTPATGSERGKRNAEIKQARDAGVSPEELPVLFARTLQRGWSKPGLAGILRNLGDLRGGFEASRAQVRQLERELEREEMTRKIAEAMGESP